MNESYLDREGQLYFGNIIGLSLYHPEMEPATPSAPIVDITDIKIFLEDVDWKARGDSVASWSGLPVNLK